MAHSKKKEPLKIKTLRLRASTWRKVQDRARAVRRSTSEWIRLKIEDFVDDLEE